MSTNDAVSPRTLTVEDMKQVAGGDAAKVREAAARMTCSNNLKQIGLA